MKEPFDKTRIKWRTYFIRPGKKGVTAMDIATGVLISEEFDSRVRGAEKKEAALRAKLEATLIRRAQSAMNQRDIE